MGCPPVDAGLLDRYLAGVLPDRDPTTIKAITAVAGGRVIAGIPYGPFLIFTADALRYIFGDNARRWHACMKSFHNCVRMHNPLCYYQGAPPRLRRPRQGARKSITTVTKANWFHDLNANRNALCYFDPVSSGILWWH